MKRFTNILLIAEESTDYSAALERAVELARNNQARLTVGNTAENILAQLDCSVLTVKPPGFRSPVTLNA